MISELIGTEQVGFTDKDIEGQHRLLACINAACLACIESAEKAGQYITRGDIIARAIGEPPGCEIDIEWTNPVTHIVWGLGIDPSVWE